MATDPKLRESSNRANQPDGISRMLTLHPKQGAQHALELALRNWTRSLLCCDHGPAVSIVRPCPPAQHCYTVIYRFDRVEELERWEASPEHTAFLDSIRKMINTDPVPQTAMGLEAWFEATAGKVGAHAMPPRYKMAVMMYLAMLPVSLFVHRSFGLFPDLQELPHLLLVALATACVVLLTTYFAMPILTRAFAGWLYPQNPPKEIKEAADTKLGEQ